MEYDKKLGLYLEPFSGLYFDPKTKLYHNLQKNIAIVYDTLTTSYFPLEVTSSDLLDQQKYILHVERKKKKLARKKGNHSLLLPLIVLQKIPRKKGNETLTAAIAILQVFLVTPTVLISL